MEEGRGLGVVEEGVVEEEEVEVAVEVAEKVEWEDLLVASFA